MEKSGRALVVPQMDPDMIISLHPEEPVRVLAMGREECIKVSCSSDQVSSDEALEILKIRRPECATCRRHVQW